MTAEYYYADNTLYNVHVLVYACARNEQSRRPVTTIISIAIENGGW